MHTHTVQGLQIYEYWAATVPSDAKSQLIGKDPDAWKDWGWEEKGATENEMVGWHHQLNGHEFGQTPGASERQGSLAYCSSQGGKETEQQQWCTFFFLACLLSSLPPCPQTFLSCLLSSCLHSSFLLAYFLPSLPLCPQNFLSFLKLFSLSISVLIVSIVISSGPWISCIECLSLIHTYFPSRTS